MVRPTLIALIGLQVVTSPVQRFPQNPIYPYTKDAPQPIAPDR
jgi:hypothetical protein